MALLQAVLLEPALCDAFTLQDLFCIRSLG
jgi:hypothetical protein